MNGDEMIAMIEVNNCSEQIKAPANHIFEALEQL
jgi:hypothetical protein